MSDIKKLYNALLSHGYTSEDLGDENTFTTAMSDANNRKELYDGASANGLDLGDYDEYERRLTQTSNNTIQATTPEPPKAEEVKPIQVPSAPTLKYGEVENKEYLTPAETTRKMMAQGVKQRQQVADMTANVQQALDDRGVELDAQARQSSQSFIPRGTAGSVAGYDAGRMYDSEYRDYAAAKEALDNAQKLMDEAVANGKEENNKGLFNGFFKGAKRGVEDLDLNNFTFGLKDASENEALLKALDAADEGNATPSQQALLDAAALQMATQADYGSSVGRGYKAGQAAGEAVPFMIEMAINPLSKVGKGIANRVARHYIKKYLGNEVLEQAAKKGTKYALTRIAPRVAQVAGDLAGSAGMAATTGAVNVTADAFKRMQGDVLYSTAEDGTVKYDGHTEGDDAATAFAKAYANSTLQNYSEMFGGYFAPLSRAAGKGITKGLSKVGLDKINSLLNEVSASDLARVVTDFEQYANWNGTMGEFAEEITGGVLNSIFVGDQTFGEVFDKENLTQTLVDVAFLGGIMSSAKVIDYPIYKYQAQSNIKKAKIPFDKLFGSEDKAVMETAFNDSDARVAGNKLREIINSDDYTEEQKMAAANYAKTIQAYKGAKLMDDKRFADPYIPQEEKNVEEAYDKGRAAETPAEMTDANNMYEIAAAEIRERFGLGEDADEKAINTTFNGDAFQKAMKLREDDVELSDLILDYTYAKATRDGVIDAARDRISEESAQAEAIIDYRKNKTDGMIHPATLKTKDANGNDRQVYIVSGNIVTFEDGTINTQESSNDIIIQDAVTGKLDFATAKDLLRAEQAIDPEVEKQNVRNTIADTIATEVENKMNNVLSFNVGDAYNVIGADGAEHSVQIIADNGDGSVMASIDNAEAVAMPKSEIQQLSNEYNMNRARLANEAQKEAKQSEEMMQEAQNIEPTQEEVAEVAQPQIPTNEQGEPMYEQAPVADTWAELVALNEGNEEEAIDTANIMLQNAQKALDKANKTPKAKGNTVAEIQAAKTERKALIDEAQAKVDYWSNVVGYRDSQPQQVVTETAPVVEEQVTEKPSNYAERNAELGDYLDFRDYVMRAIATKGVKFIWKDSDTGTRGLRAHLGLSPKELGAHLWMLDNKVGLYPEVAAEQLLASYTEEIGGEPNIDTMDALSEILDVIGSYPNQAKMFQAVMERHGENADAQAQAEEDAIFRSMRAEAEQNGMTVEDYIIYQEYVLNEDLTHFEENYEQIIATFVESAFNEETLNQNNNERGRNNEDVPQGVHREGGLSDGGETGVGVLQTERMDDGSRDSGGVEAGQGGDVQAVEQSIDDIPATEVSGRAEEVKEKTISAPAQEADISDEDIAALWIKSRDELWKPNDELGQMLHEKLYEAHPEEHQPEDRKKVVRHLIEAVEKHKDHPIAKDVLKYVKYPTPNVSSESKDATSEPKSQEVDEKILQEEQKVNVNPTDGQKEAGNYKKGHVVVDGFNITIEQPKGSVRSGVDADGKEWSITMNNTYGYIRGTEGVDGDHIDVFLSDNLDNWGGEVFVVDQINTDGSFDEHKVMYGFNSIEEAQQAYLSNYSEGWQGLGAITGISKDEFKKWIASSHRKTKPFAEYKSVKTTEGQAVNTTDSANLANDVTAIESNVDEKPVNKPKSDKKIEDFGEKIGGARKDIARARLLDTVKLSAKDLESLKDPDKILSRKAIIKYMEEGQMTENDGISLLALNMATRGKYRKALTMEKYREVALQWERGEDIDVGITEQDIDKYMANMPEAARVKPNARERAISDLERIILTPYNDYRDTYIALNYPAEYRNLRGTYIYKTAWNDKVVVVSGIDSRRGFVFNTYEQAVAKIKRDFPIVEFEKSKEKSTAKDNKDSEGHLNITKDDMGWYRIKSRSIPGNIYLSGRFRTKKDAEAYLEQNKEVLLEREQKMTESLMGSNIGMVEREGVDYRNGQDVTPEDFLNTFGFRGVEFGNWVPQAERQLYLNKTYDAIMDFCNIIGISPKAFSLGGELALAFGARGKSRALAHYEPLKMVINLTRMKGAGSLAHEWFHAFDNYISKRKTGNISDMATARFAAERDEVSRAFYDLVSKMNSMDYTKRSKRAGEYWGEVEERAARLLENYIYNELERKSQVSPLLVRKDTLFNEEEIPEEDYVKSAWPYPSARENKEIKPYFDHLFSTLEEKVDEQGNVILFRSSAPTYDDLKIRFAELQSEYDALDKNNEQALNAWRDKKAEVGRSFMEGKTEELNLPTKNFRIVKNEEELRSLYNDYSSAMNKWMQDTNKDFVSIDSFNKFKERLSKAQALYSPVMDVIACDINSFPNDEAMAFTVLFHEQTHSVIDKVFKQKQLKDIWDEALINDAKNANDISASYGDDVYENGNEYLAFILERFTFANFRNRLESFIKGDEAVLVDDLMKNAKETLPLRNEAIKKILKFYNDGYRKERGFRTETRNDGLGRGYAEGSREATTESSRGGSQSSRERRRSEVVEAATDLASSLGVKLNVIEDLNEINDSNPKMRKSKRGNKAWYNVKTDQVYFVAPNATSIADAQESVLHEVVAHKGLRDVVGRENFDKFLDKVFQSAAPEIRAQIVRLALQNGWNFSIATEEYLASLAEEGFDSRENRTFWQKVRDFFMDMLREAKIVIGYNITDNDMRYMLWRTYQKQKSQGAMAVAEDVVMQQKLGVGNFRTRPAGTRQMTEEEQIIADAKANGTYLKAPNGKDTNLTPKQWVQVRTKAFKEWFGDWEYSPENASKIVDENGEPKVVEHSTWNDDFYTFDIEHLGESSGDEGVYGAGFYFGNIGDTEIYGDRAIQAYLNMRNPIVLPDAPIRGFFDYLVKNFDKEGLRDIVIKGDNKTVTMGDVVDAIKEVNKAHVRGEYADLIEQMSQYWYPADEMVLEQQIFRKIGFAIYGTLQPFIEYNVGRKEFSEALRNAGYDGVVYDSTEYVAFNPNQIKSATENVGTFDANNDDIRFRTTPNSADIEDGEVKGVREAFDKKVRSAWYQVKEAAYDNRQALKEYMRLATKAHGANLPNDDMKHIEAWENPYMAIMQKSSINQKEVESWEKKYYHPILNAIYKILDVAEKRDVGALRGIFGTDSMDDIINNYLQGKHGLERNRDMAVRNALDEMAKATLITKKEVEELLEQVNTELQSDIITPTEADARRQQIGNMLSTKKFTKEQVQAQTEVWKQRKDAIRNDDSMTWAEKQRALDNVATTEFGVDLAAKDYSGLGEVFPNEDGKLEQSIEDAYTAVEAFEELFDTKDLWDAIKAANNATIEKSFRSGIINKATMDSIRDMYDYYIPLRGFEAATTEDVYGYLNNEPRAFSMPVKRANGRASKAEFAIPHILQMAHSAILQGNNNLVKMKMANFAQHYPTDLIKQDNMYIEYDEADKEWRTPKYDIPEKATPEEANARIEAKNESLAELAKTNPNKVRKVSGKMDVPYIVQKDNLSKHQIPYKRNGVDYILTVNGDPRLAFVMNGELEKAATTFAGKAGEAVESFTRYLSSMYTQYNPEFMLSNAYRDGTWVLATVPIRENAKYTAKFYKNYFKLIVPGVMQNLFVRYEKGTLDMSNNTHREFANFIKNGGETGYAILKDVENTKKRVSKDIHPSLWSKTMKLIDKLGIVARGVESSARFAAYLASREEGRSITRSAYDAKEVSVNFNRKGAGAAFNDLPTQTLIGQIAGATAGTFKLTHTFFNAGMQGLAGVAKLVKYNPFKATTAFSSAFLLGMVVASLFDDDDDYYNLTETVRRQNIIIRAGEDYVSIPLAIELRAMYGLGEMMVSMARGKEDVTKHNVAYKIADQILQAFPINILEGNGGIEALLPTAVALVEEVLVNEDWQGMPIYREDKYTADESNPEWQMVNNYTGRGYIAASKFLSEISGGNEGKRGTIEINPAVVQHIAEGVLGGPLSFFDKTVATIDIARGKKDFEWRNIPFASRIMKDGGGKAQERAMNREYYNNEKRYDAMHESEKDYEKIANDPNRSKEDREKYRLLLEELKGSPEYKQLNAFHEASLEIDKMYRDAKKEDALDKAMPDINKKKEEANAILEK